MAVCLECRAHRVSKTTAHVRVPRRNRCPPAWHLDSRGTRKLASPLLGHFKPPRPSRLWRPRFLINPNRRSTQLTVVKSRWTWVLTSKNSPTNSNDTHCHPCALPSLESEPPRLPPPAVAVRPHRRLLRPNYGHHPTLGEHVVDPDPPPAGSAAGLAGFRPTTPPPMAMGGIARGRVFLGGFVQSRGISVRH
jgi:hypothetical protein